MELDRDSFVRRLRRLHLGGEITEAVLRPDLSASAVTQDHAVFVDVPAGSPKDVLPRPTGLVDFPELIGLLVARSEPNVEIHVDDARLIVDEGEYGELSFLTAEPDAVGTRVGPDSREEMLAFLEQYSGAPLGRETVERLSSLQKHLGSLEILLCCESDGATFQVGPDSSHHATYRKSDLTTAGTNEDQFNLILPAHTVMRIFDLIADPDEAEIVLTGEGKVVGFKFEGYTYLVNAMRE